MATAQKIVLSVNLSSDRKTKALIAVSKLSDIDSLAIDTKAQLMTAIGSVDPVDVVKKLRKLGFLTQIVSVGPAIKAHHDKKDGGGHRMYCIEPSSIRGDKNDASATLEKFTLEFLSRITNNFSEERIIGRAGYGVLYKGVRDNGECIAVIKLHLMPGLDEEEFKNVFNNLMRVQHQNTINLVGYCHDITQVPVEYNGQHVSARVEERALCFEYLQGGSLDKHLSNEPCGLPWHICYKIIRGICEGLHYLHKGMERPIYHLDLKPETIFLDWNMSPEIGGFGLSRLFDSIETNNTSAEASVYMPPEYIERGIISPKFDVFSLGVIIIQIMAGKEGYSKCADIRPKEFIELVHKNWVKRMQPPISKFASREVQTCIEIALKCVGFDRVTRPTITEILDKLNKIYIAECSSIDQLYRTREFTLEFLEHITNKFSEENIVGRGGYGVIYKGVLDNGEEIAVKKLHQMLCIDDEQVKRELNNLMRVQHKNIVRLIGYCRHTAQTVVDYHGKLVSASVEQRAICLEYLQGGSLDKHLSDEACLLDWDICYKIIKGICEGIHYLHYGSDNPIYHLDLKPANILLDKDKTPKIADFGLSRLFDSIQTYMTQSQDVIGTRGYMPPEYIDSQKISQKFDVYSLGVIIIQMMAGKEGYFDCADTPRKEFIKLVHGNWRKRLQGTTMSFHASQEVRTCIEIALKCVEPKRVQRPTISQIVNELSNIGTAESSPLDKGAKRLKAFKTLLLCSHLKYLLYLVIAVIAIFLSWSHFAEDVSRRIEVGWVKWHQASDILCHTRVPQKLKGIL